MYRYIYILYIFEAQFVICFSCTKYVFKKKKGKKKKQSKAYDTHPLDRKLSLALTQRKHSATYGISQNRNIVICCTALL